MENHNFIDSISISNIENQMRTTAHAHMKSHAIASKYQAAIRTTRNSIFQDGRETSCEDFQVWEVCDQARRMDYGLDIVKL